MTATTSDSDEHVKKVEENPVVPALNPENAGDTSNPKTTPDLGEHVKKADEIAPEAASNGKKTQDPVTSTDPTKSGKNSKDENAPETTRDVKALREGLILPFLVFFSVGAISILIFTLVSFYFADEKWIPFLRIQQVTLGMLIGFFLSFLGVSVSWMGIEASYDFRAEGKGNSLALVSSSVAPLLILAGSVLLGIALTRQMTWVPPSKPSEAASNPEVSPTPSTPAPNHKKLAEPTKETVATSPVSPSVPVLGAAATGILVTSSGVFMMSGESVGYFEGFLNDLLAKKEGFDEAQFVSARSEALHCQHLLEDAQKSECLKNDKSLKVLIDCYRLFASTSTKEADGAKKYEKWLAQIESEYKSLREQHPDILKPKKSEASNPRIR
jgi:hypothetical protein